MKRDDIIRILAVHEQDLKRLQVKSLALFGSVARDETKTDSDIDLLVEFEGTPTFDRYMDLKFLLESCFAGRVNLVTHGALKPRLSSHVEREAIRVA